MPDIVLIISPHTDDGELGCGGTIVKFLEMKKKIHLVAFSSAKKSIPSNLDEDITKKEMLQACKILGLKDKYIRILDFDNRVFPSFRQEILDALIELRNEIDPQIVMVPSLKDTHQDHEVVTREALRAFKKTSLSIYGYEQPWNCLTFDTIGFVALDERHIEKKIRALKEYKTQSHKEYVDPEFIKGLARTRGTQIGRKYAEAFEIIRQVIP